VAGRQQEGVAQRQEIGQPCFGDQTGISVGEQKNKGRGREEERVERNRAAPIAL